MTSRALSQNAFLDPGSSLEDSFKGEKGSGSRKVNVYDAVAGKISAAGFIPKQLVYSSTRDTPSSSVNPVAPEAVLFRRKNAPPRYAESDLYFANERQVRTDLPESDLLKALHCYTSDFYSSATPEGGAGDWKSLDESALIALGILMEEATMEPLSKTGDLAFTEGEQVDEKIFSESPRYRFNSKQRSSKKRRIVK